MGGRALRAKYSKTARSLKNQYARRGLGDIGGVRYGHSHFLLLQRRSVIDAVTGHAHNVAGMLKYPDEAELVLRKHARKYVTLRRSSFCIRVQAIERTGGACDPDLRGDGAVAGPSPVII